MYIKEIKVGTSIPIQEIKFNKFQNTLSKVSYIEKSFNAKWNEDTAKYKTQSVEMQCPLQTRLGVPSIAGRLLKVIETCVYDLSLQTHTPLHYILGLSSQPLTPAKR